MLSVVLPPLEILEGARPVVAHQPRQRAVGEQSALGLARGTVVRLVSRIDDPLHRRTAAWASLSISAVHRPSLADRGDLLGEPPRLFRLEPLRPLVEDLARRVE